MASASLPRSRAGRNTLTWNGKAGKKAAAPGADRVVVAALGADGQRAQDGVPLTVKRR